MNNGAVLHYVIGDATNPSRDNPGIIVHVCNDIGAWGKGFVLAVSARWKEPELQFRSWFQGNEAIPYELGEVQFVAVEEYLWVANLVGQHGIRARGGTPPVRYDAIREGLNRVAKHAQGRGAVVHMPRIACGLAGGTWDAVEPIIQAELIAQGVPVQVYDRPS